jgi:hypothetical protein
MRFLDLLPKAVRLGRTRHRDPHARLRQCSAALSLVLAAMIGMDVCSFAPAHVSARPERDGAQASARWPGEDQIDAWLEQVQTRPLFKPATPLPARPMARESVNRVRGLLSLHGIMERDGEPVAYINVRGLGMKAYRLGDDEPNVFKVMVIRDRSVELEIVGERVELEL